MDIFHIYFLKIFSVIVSLKLDVYMIPPLFLIIEFKRDSLAACLQFTASKKCDN